MGVYANPRISEEKGLLEFIVWVDVSDIFYFFLLGEGKGESRRRRAVGDWFFIEKPRRGGASRTGGAEGPGGCLQRIGEFGGGGGAKYFFGGPKCPPS